MRLIPRGCPASLVALASTTLTTHLLARCRSVEASSSLSHPPPNGTSGIVIVSSRSWGVSSSFGLPRGGGGGDDVGDQEGGSSDEPTKETLRVWSGKDAAAFIDRSHPGYSHHPDPDLLTGGWLAHREKIEPSEGGDGTTTVDGNEAPPPSHCWVRDEVSAHLTRFDYKSMPIGRPPRILILYGSLRPESFSRKMAYEFARLLEALGCDVRVYHPRGLPVRDPSLESSDPKVAELRALTHWSDGHLWVSPEVHGTITGAFKNQIDWIPLNTGSVRPTQGKTCCVAQVNGGSQSFNAVNALRLLARWMRMPCCTNQSAVPKAWREFDAETGRMKPSSYRDRVVDVAEEFAKFTAIMAPLSDELTDRYSERKEKEVEGELLTQEEKERRKTAEESRKG